MVILQRIDKFTFPPFEIPPVLFNNKLKCVYSPYYWYLFLFFIRLLLGRNRKVRKTSLNKKVPKYLKQLGTVFVRIRLFIMKRKLVTSCRILVPSSKAGGRSM